MLVQDGLHGLTLSGREGAGQRVVWAGLLSARDAPRLALAASQGAVGRALHGLAVSTPHSLSELTGLVPCMARHWGGSLFLGRLGSRRAGALPGCAGVWSERGRGRVGWLDVGRGGVFVSL
ncbi:hypothetical protein E2C01_061586 [Portunus trituberculatus]|uniref:Uncharacterized protein n=1 Tax=Portunus trituberculatus TaxID=210409 RepID=A0A5B7H486_PORTR|nr:hypothetical protein [Portunus trituberculatus]